MFLATENLVFSGHFESHHLDGSHGNFLELMKLIAWSDAILENHLKMAKVNLHPVHYFSHKIQNELIYLVASEVKRLLILRN